MTDKGGKVKSLRYSMLMVLVVLATHALAGPDEEKAGLAKILPRFKEAWNTGQAKGFIAIFHAESRMRKAYEKDDEAKKAFERSFKQMVEEFGKVESFEVRKYIEKKGRYVVRVTYIKKGMIPGTFAVKGNDQDGWFILDFNVDGQGEPELKE